MHGAGAWSRSMDDVRNLHRPSDTRVDPAPACQQRTMQSRVEVSRLTGVVTEATSAVSSGGDADGANDAGNASQFKCGDTAVQLVGTARVIHVLRNGFLSAGVAPLDTRWS